MGTSNGTALELKGTEDDGSMQVPLAVPSHVIEVKKEFRRFRQFRSCSILHYVIALF